MNNHDVRLNRRNVLAIGLAVTCSGTAASTLQTYDDPEMDAIESRMLNVSQRGTSLSLKQKYLVLVSAAASQGCAESLGDIVTRALKDKISPVAIKEAIYQCAPYAGMSRTRSIYSAVNDSMRAAGIKLPLPTQATTTDADRIEKGIAVQTAIFGDDIGKMHSATPEKQRPLVVDDLSGWCFGDFYTRKGLTVRERELVTFTAIASLGGCEAQLKAHTAANIREGNSKQNLIDALHIAVPLLGFPRTLNALAVVNTA